MFNFTATEQCGSSNPISTVILCGVQVTILILRPHESRVTSHVGHVHTRIVQVPPTREICRFYRLAPAVRASNKSTHNESTVGAGCTPTYFHSLQQVRPDVNWVYIVALGVARR
jgi:hypothetical protein